jgi:hypothetical protein
MPSVGTLGCLAGLVTAGRAVESYSQYRYLGVSSIKQSKLWLGGITVTWHSN